MTVNLILYVVRYHYDFIKINSTNFVVHNSHLGWDNHRIEPY